MILPTGAPGPGIPPLRRRPSRRHGPPRYNRHGLADAAMAERSAALGRGDAGGPATMGHGEPSHGARVFWVKKW